ncbi:MAG: hypothetical protein JWQ07_1168 [Ramlibacter sp.]|nr:hypothetical protein [Ramlibacter sp.]
MDPDLNDDKFAQSAAEPASSPPPTPGQALAPTLAVMAVAIAALAAAMMTRHTQAPPDHRAAAQSAQQAVAQEPSPVVTAPPLNTMGAGPACQTCGTVESVVAADAPNKNYRMRIRMDGGSFRTVEQRGALAAGSRVVLDGATVRLMPGNG